MQSAQANTSAIPRRVLFVGRLSPEKGVDVLLRAWSLLINSPFSADAAANHSSLVTRHLSLTIVGDGPERPALESLAATLGISDRVEFAGTLSRTATRDMMSSAALLVLPSICYETFGLAILEAASLGVPAIVTDIGGQAALVQDGVTGRHVPPGNPSALASALQDLLSNPVTLRRMGEAAHAAFQTSDCIPSRNLSRLERVYASCARPSSNHPENHG
jgi:glycosyltransferase involved in cell wall biosynthesis